MRLPFYEYQACLRRRLAAAMLLAALIPSAVEGNAARPADLTELSIEELMSIEVVSVSKRLQPLSDTAAAVFVITQEDIRRSGVTNIPEALRMAPGVEAARIDASRWAVSARGFNGRFSNKLLVLIDGRTVYTPAFSGVYWENLAYLPLEAIERIEVIRGPGATLWGANAVNGIINIITQPAWDTQGGEISLSVGSEERAIATARYGVRLREKGFLRLQGKFRRHDDSLTLEDVEAGDDWDLASAGFRWDWQTNDQNQFSMYGDIYDGNLDQNLTLPLLTPPFARRLTDEVNISGGDLTARWEHFLSSSSRVVTQVYYQREEREEIFIGEVRDTLDLDFQHSFAPAANQELVWGLGYRFTSDKFANTDLTALFPDSRDDHLFSFFLQDELRILEDRLRLTFGSKLEYNDYTGWEIQPSTRFLWKPHPQHRVWGAVSRAVRTPSRAENDVRAFTHVFPPDSAAPGPLPLQIAFLGNRDLDSENLLAWELGYRAWAPERLSLDATIYYNLYDELFFNVSGTPFLDATSGAPHLTLPSQIENSLSGDTYGLELAVDWQARDWWRLHLAYDYSRNDLDFDADNGDQNGNPVQNSSPRHQLSLRSALDLGRNVELDLWFRYVDELPALLVASTDTPIRIDDYLDLDMRLSWRPIGGLELSVVGQNLLDNAHREFTQEIYPFPVQTERAVYGQVRWTFGDQ